MSERIILDDILPVKEGKLISLDGVISLKRNQMIKQFILTGLEDDGMSCVVTLTRSADDLIEELTSFSPEAGMLMDEALMNENLQIVDLYSFRGVKPDGSIPGVHFMDSAKDLTMLSIKLNQIGKSSQKVRFVLWPYSLLAIYTEHKDLINFTQTLSARLNSRKQIGILINDSGVIPSQQKATLDSIVDSVVETRREEQKGVIHEWFRIRFFRGHENTGYETWKHIAE